MTSISTTHVHVHCLINLEKHTQKKIVLMYCHSHHLLLIIAFMKSLNLWFSSLSSLFSFLKVYLRPYHNKLILFIYTNVHSPQVTMQSSQTLYIIFETVYKAPWNKVLSSSAAKTTSRDILYQQMLWSITKAKRPQTKSTYVSLVWIFKSAWLKSRSTKVIDQDRNIHYYKLSRMSNTFCKLYLEQAFIDPNPTSSLTVAQVYITAWSIIILNNCCDVV